MDTQLQELIEAIKTEGVQTAEKQAEQIVASAEEKSKSIIAEAEKRAREMVEQARAEQTKLDLSGREALSQAARDLILGVQGKLRQIFESVVEAATGEAISADILENSIVSVVNALGQGRSDSLDVLLSASDLDKLEQRLRNRLAEQISAGAEIRPNDAIKSGFRVSSRDDGMYYDFTVETIAETLSAYVGPRLTEVLKEAAAKSGS